MESDVEDKEVSFRDKLYNITREGKRLKIYPQKPRGRYYTWRTAVSILLLVLLFAGPYIRIGGHPLLLLNILERKFVLFGIPFWPQDFHLFVLSGLSIIVFVVLFTSIYGRVWCGWLCPQTIFMEMVFRKIEYWIEGNAAKMRSLDRQPLSRNKVLRKIAKHIVFFAISFIIANTFLAYIIGSEELITIITDPPSEHLAGLIAITIFSLVFYGVFARFREQVCIIVCPYGRWQSVMVDRNTIAVTYDFGRGEPRRKLTKQDKAAWAAAQTNENPTPERGDCVECRQCVNVCPTGIDIRNGIQLECVNCTACMDACDEIMKKVNRPKGLIRYASYNSIVQPEKRRWNPRVLGYTAVLVALLASLGYFYSIRADVESTILRQPGTLFNEVPDNKISNFYTYKIVNKTFNELSLELRLLAPEGDLIYIGEMQPVQGQSVAEGRFYIALPRTVLTGQSTPVRFAVISGGRVLEEVESFFIGPER